MLDSIHACCRNIASKNILTTYFRTPKLKLLKIWLESMAMWSPVEKSLCHGDISRPTETLSTTLTRYRYHGIRMYIGRTLKTYWNLFPNWGCDILLHQCGAPVALLQRRKLEHDGTERERLQYGQGHGPGHLHGNAQCLWAGWLQRREGRNLALPRKQPATSAKVRRWRVVRQKPYLLMAPLDVLEDTSALPALQLDHWISHLYIRKEYLESICMDVRGWLLHWYLCITLKLPIYTWQLGIFYPFENATFYVFLISCYLVQ